MSKLKLLNLALEDIADGLARKEREFVWYGVIDDASVFTGMSSSFQIQCNIKDDCGSVRVRKAIEFNEGTHTNTEYTLTVKSKTKAQDASESMEATLPTTKSFFDTFESAVDEIMVKRRYTFKQNGFNYEVDVATKELRLPQEGDFVKIDIEVSDVVQNDDIPKEVPGVSIKVTNQKDTQTEEEKNFINEIHRNHLGIKKDK